MYTSNIKKSAMFLLALPLLLLAVLLLPKTALADYDANTGWFTYENLTGGSLRADINADLAAMGEQGNYSLITKLKISGTISSPDLNHIYDMVREHVVEIDAAGAVFEGRPVGFSWYVKLERVRMPAGTTITSEFFKGCGKLKTLVCGNGPFTEGEIDLTGAIGLEHDLLAQSGVERVRLPAGVPIPHDMFRFCTSLTTLIFPAGDAPTVEQGNPFENISPNGTLYYPVGANGYEAFRDAYLPAGWRVVPITSTDSEEFTLDFLSLTFTHRATGIIVSGDGIANISRLIVQPNKLDPAGACVACDEIRKRNPLAVYDISLTNGHRGSVDVFIPLSGSGYYTVLHCNDGVLEEQTVPYASGGVTSTWKKLSPFAVVRANVSVPENTIVDPPKTGAGSYAPIGLALVLCALGAGVPLRKKRHSTNS